MKNCSYCGRENDSAAVHCRDCGTVFEEREDRSWKTPRRPNPSSGLRLAAIGLVIGAFSFGMPIASARRHVPGKILVSFAALLAAALFIVYGVAYAWVGRERATEAKRSLWWIAFFLSIVLCIALFQILDELGYPYR